MRALREKEGQEEKGFLGVAVSLHECASMDFLHKKPVINADYVFAGTPAQIENICSHTDTHTGPQN